MLKNNKGITLVSLVITIIVLMILASIATSNGLSAVKNAKYYNAISELKVMQAEVNEMYEDYKNGNEDVLNNGKSLTESAKNEQAVQAYNLVNENKLNETDIGIISDYRYYGADYINNDLDIDGISQDFIINIKTRSVILLNGIEINGETYHALCEIEGEQYNVKYEK